MYMSPAYCLLFLLIVAAVFLVDYLAWNCGVVSRVIDRFTGGGGDSAHKCLLAGSSSNNSF